MRTINEANPNTHTWQAVYRCIPEPLSSILMHIFKQNDISFSLFCYSLLIDSFWLLHIFVEQTKQKPKTIENTWKSERERESLEICWRDNRHARCSVNWAPYACMMMFNNKKNGQKRRKRRGKQKLDYFWTVFYFFQKRKTAVPKCFHCWSVSF